MTNSHKHNHNVYSNPQQFHGCEFGRPVAFRELSSNGLRDVKGVKTDLSWRGLGSFSRVTMIALYFLFDRVPSCIRLISGPIFSYHGILRGVIGGSLEQGSRS